MRYKIWGIYVPENNVELCLVVYVDPKGFTKFIRRTKKRVGKYLKKKGFAYTIDRKTNHAWCMNFRIGNVWCNKLVTSNVRL